MSKDAWEAYVTSKSLDRQRLTVLLTRCLSDVDRIVSKLCHHDQCVEFVHIVRGARKTM
jgi:hypothetical protein